MGGSLYRRGFLSTGVFIDLGLLIVAIFFFIMASDYPDMARTFPRLVLMMIGVFTVLDMLYVLRAEKKKRSRVEESEEVRAVHSPPLYRVLYMAALMFVFYLLLASVGLIFGTLIFILLSGWTLGYKKPKTLILSSVIITVFIYLIFHVIMKSILPEALIFELIRG